MNRRPSGPKPDALARLRHAPNHSLLPANRPLHPLPRRDPNRSVILPYPRKKGNWSPRFTLPVSSVRESCFPVPERRRGTALRCASRTCCGGRRTRSPTVLRRDRLALPRAKKAIRHVWSSPYSLIRSSHHGKVESRSGRKIVIARVAVPWRSGSRSLDPSSPGAPADRPVGEARRAPAFPI